MSTAAADEMPARPAESIVGTPARRPGSVRRTASITTVWPNGTDGDLRLVGRCRDLHTPANGAAVVLAEASMIVDIGPMHTITGISVSPDRPGVERLVGAPTGSRLRTAIDEAAPGEREAATPLHFLLDDLAGAVLVTGLVVSRARDRARITQPPQAAVTTDVLGVRNGRIVCSGLRPDGYALRLRATGTFEVPLSRAGDLSSGDPWAWHDTERPAGTAMRRRRRLDVWRDGDRLVVDAHFRDSLWDDAESPELAAHEYAIRAEIDHDTHTLERIEVDSRVLPWPECPWAVPHVAQLVGQPIDTFRSEVHRTLTAQDCCTHLNDMLRGLTEVPRFARVL